MKRKFLALVLCLAVFAGTITGCGNSNEVPSEEPAVSEEAEVEEPTAEETKDTITNVAFLAPLTSSEYWMTITENTKKACEAEGIECTIYSAESDAATQLEQAENAITMGFDAIIIDALDPVSADIVLEKAKAAGIFVLVTGTITENVDVYDVAIGVSETQVGDAAAKAAAEWIDATYPDAEDGSIGVALYTLPFRPVDIERCDAFANVTKYTSKANIDIKYELSVENFTTEVPQYAEVMLQSYPNVKCVISYSDMFANSIDEILKNSTGVDISGIANITVDQSTATYTNITLNKNGESTVAATVVPGIDLAEQLVDVLKGNITFDEADKKLIYKEITVVTGENVDQYFTAE